MVATVYLFLFIACGFIISFSAFKEAKYAFKLVASSVFGITLLQWLPVVFALFFNFTLTSHILALITAIIISAVFVFIFKLKPTDFIPKTKPTLSIILILSGIYLIFITLALHSFRYENGEIYSSQATYGDMNLHLGIITSIAQSVDFPPNYSILPSELLSYPFLSNSISSSFYLLGASLNLSYFLPMFFAGANVIGGFYLFLRTCFRKNSKIILAIIIFFFSGGFGFFYFLPTSLSDLSNFTRIFTAFYETPTNNIENNIFFVNTIVDMMVPQRSTLFGWAILFFTLANLNIARKTNSLKHFILVGILGGLMPMINTHSFVNLAIISACWLGVSLTKNAKSGIKLMLCLLPFIFTIIQFVVWNDRDNPALLLIAVVLIAIPTSMTIFIGDYNINKLKNWGIYLVVVLVLALPQLFTWTFTQSDNEGFMRAYFGWSNTGDNYLWFYLKNLGLISLLFIPSVIFAKRSIVQTISPIIPLLIFSELIVLQPNVYDNNKIIFLAYALICVVCADFCVNVYHKIKGKSIFLSRALAVLTVFIFTISATLTMGREYLASYLLYDKPRVELAEFVKSSTSVTSTFLTGDRHNNEISSLTGRYLVCGSPTFLHFHGLNYFGTAQEVKLMYEQPAEYTHLFEQHNTDYILISKYELRDYAIDTEYFSANFDLIYYDESENISLYAVKYS